MNKTQIFNLFDQGKRPQDINDPEHKRKTINTYYYQWRAQRATDQGPDEEAKDTRRQPLATAMSFTMEPKTFTVPFTPTMKVAYEAAVNEWGMPQETRWETFLDTILQEFFKDRAIQLSAYVILSGDGHQPVAVTRESSYQEEEDGGKSGPPGENTPSTDAEQSE